ncbi:hypothetical protein [Synechococcus sp. N32]|uniref:hypothetical protein n=1 Tax=Synechococcus sp. N32 TaxID=2575514 RepID=UPI001482CC5A|nr:hypothetical protein [Synechococcus sp. N32]
MGRSSWLKNPTRCSAASTWQPQAQAASSAQVTVKASTAAVLLKTPSISTKAA